MEGDGRWAAGTCSSTSTSLDRPGLEILAEGRVDRILACSGLAAWPVSPLSCYPDQWCRQHLDCDVIQA